jgi:uncharacterized protein YbgA (DUF1722 family)/uncharacterized protein YbbK (DUF523 family)
MHDKDMIKTRISSNQDSARPRVAVSACLMGKQVRFDGGHKRSRFITDKLSDELDFVHVCPEIEAGMGVPRPVIQLRRVDGEIRLMQSDGSTDHTDAMLKVATRRALTLGSEIDGFIFKSKSPSCGMERVPVAGANGRKQDRTGVGIFVAQFTRLAPLVPIEEEGRLNDPMLRENFLERVYAYRRWRELDQSDVAGFIAFHARHKLMLMARGPAVYRRLGRIVAGVTQRDLAERRDKYILAFMQEMRGLATRKRHYNVLQHAMGYFKRSIDADDKQELLGLMQSYREMQVPLATPVAMLKHHLRKHPDRYLVEQHYFKPYPDALGLRAYV